MLSVPGRWDSQRFHARARFIFINLVFTSLVVIEPRTLSLVERLGHRGCGMRTRNM